MARDTPCKIQNENSRAPLFLDSFLMHQVAVRELALRVYRYTHSLRKTALMCGVSVASISRWAKQLHPKQRLFPRPVTSDAMVASVDSFMRSKTRCSSREVVDHILTTWGFTISRQLAHCIIRRLGFTFKRIRKRGKCLHSPSHNEKLEAFFREFDEAYSKGSLASLDESGFDQRAVPVYGYCSFGLPSYSRVCHLS